MAVHNCHCGRQADKQKARWRGACSRWEALSSCCLVVCLKLVYHVVGSTLGMTEEAHTKLARTCRWPSRNLRLPMPCSAWLLAKPIKAAEHWHMWQTVECNSCAHTDRTFTAQDQDTHTHWASNMVKSNILEAWGKGTHISCITSRITE